MPSWAAIVVVGVVSLLPLASGCSSLALTVRAMQPRADGPVELQVLLMRERRAGDDAPCLRVSRRARARVDGAPLQLKERGGRNAGGGCKPVRFELAAGARRPTAQAVNTITVSDGELEARVSIARLLSPRRLRVRPSKTLRSGDRASVSWPKPDQVFAPLPQRSLYFYWPADGFSGTLGPHRIEQQGRSFHFTVPAMRPGNIWLRLEPGAPHPRARVVECSVARCDAGAALPARPLRLKIVGD